MIIKFTNQIGKRNKLKYALGFLLKNFINKDGQMCIILKILRLKVIP